MNCCKCGKKLPENAVFCPACGERNDGKKECPNCHTYIDKEDIFCPICGKCVDGKSKCQNCGAEFSGNFCPSCGTPVGKIKKEIPKVTVKRSLSSVLCNIVSPSFLLVGILLLFIFGFFLGVINNSVFETETVKESYSTFYFFGKVYEEARGTEQSLIPIIMITIAISAFFIVAFTLLTVAVVKFVASVKNNTEVNFGKFFAWTFATFLFAVACILAYSKFNISSSLKYSSYYDEPYSSTMSSYIKLNNTTVVAIILSLILTVVSLIIKEICNFNIKKLPSKIIGLISVALSVLFLLLISGVCIKVESSSNGITDTSSTTIKTTMSLAISQLQLLKNSEFEVGATKFILCYYFLIIALAMGALILSFMLSHIFEDKNDGFINTALSAVMVSFTILYLVLITSIIEPYREGLEKTDMVYYTVPIIGIIIAVVLLGLSITQTVLSKKASDTKETGSLFENML